MELVDPLRMSRASSILQKETEQYGGRLRLGRDFKKFKKAIDKLPDRNISNQFNLDYETLTPPTSFWLMIKNSKGELVAGVAAKLEELGPMPAPIYWEIQHRRVYRDQSLKLIEFKSRQSRAAYALSGKLAYVGDAYARPEFRKTGLAAAMGKLAMISALNLWPDLNHCYAFIHNEGMTKGIATNHGFAHQHPTAIRWENESNPASLPENMWLVSNSASDILDLIDQLNDDPT